jgi:Fe-S oxidoreductase
MERLQPLFEQHPDRKIVGLEPSALLTFRDESLDLCDVAHKPTAKACADRAVLFEEFIAEVADEGRLQAAFKAPAQSRVLLHGHCHQKALVGTGPTERALEAAGYAVETLPTGCCGMAGSFGYEADHYDVSMDIGELVLFPALRDAGDETLVCAPGTSCRHQIYDGVERVAEHPAVLLERALS